MNFRVSFNWYAAHKNFLYLWLMLKLTNAFVGLLLLAGPVFSQKRNVIVTLTCTYPYCGGARPTEEMMADAQKPKPYAEKLVVVVSKTGKVDSAKTDKSGVLKLKLKAGTYMLCESWRFRKSGPQNEPLSSFDTECLKTEWSKTITTFTVGKKAVVVKDVAPIEFQCNWRLPCLKDGNRAVPE